MDGYYEYNPNIYPRLLWVAIGASLQELQSLFDGLPQEEDVVKFNGCVFEEVSRRGDDRLGVLVLFSSRKTMTMNTMSHEASHVVDEIEHIIGADHGGEPSAYLLGWVATCFNNARMKIGDYIVVNQEKKGKTI